MFITCIGTVVLSTASSDALEKEMTHLPEVCSDVITFRDAPSADEAHVDMVKSFRTAAKWTWWDTDSYPVGFHTCSISSEARCDSNSPSTGACLQLGSQTSFLIPPWSRRQNLGTGGPGRAAPSSHEPGRKLR